MARPNQVKDLRLVNKVCRMYYDQNLSEDLISGRLHLSRPKISRLLKYAREIGMVKISVVSPPGIHTDLEGNLEAKYGLQEAIVVDVGDLSSREALTREIGAAAARHLQETLQEGDIIGISWGTTLHAMVTAVQPQKSQNYHVVQIIGGLGIPTSEAHATDICRRLASALSAKLTLLPAPGIMSSVQARDAILSDIYVKKAMSQIGNIRVAYLGIGSPSPDSVVIRDGNILTSDDLGSLQSKGAVGDVALRYFNAHGAPIISELDERVIGITYQQLRNTPNVVGVAGGLDKVAAIRGALLGKLVKTLVTDYQTALCLMED